MRLARVVVVVIMVVVVVVVVTRGLYSSTAAAAAVAAVHLAASLALFSPRRRRSACCPRKPRNLFRRATLLSHILAAFTRKISHLSARRLCGSFSPHRPRTQITGKLPELPELRALARGGDFAPSRDATRFVTASNNGDARRLFYLLTTRCDWKRYTIEIDLHRGI